jgi:uncharacterized Fe-S cluster protein YjdI
LKEIIRHYHKGGLKITWKPSLCIHSGICAQGLPAVFQPREKPWIKPENSETEKIVEQIKKCPSGALSLTMENEKKTSMPETRIQVASKGPYLVKGKFLFVDDQGNETLKEGNIALCRCGLSKNKPFCDGAHKTSNVLG